MKILNNLSTSLLFILLLCFTQKAFAQFESQAVDSTKIADPYKKRAFIGFSGGIARPIGNFSNRSTESTNSALAEIGSAFNLIELNYRLFDQFHLSIGYWNIRNGVDEQAVRNRLIAEQGKQYEVEATNYSLRLVVAGVGLTKTSNSLDVDLRFQLAYGSAFSPSFNIEEFDPSTNIRNSYKKSAEKENGFGAGISMAFRIHLNSYLDLKPSANYFLFQKEFNNLSLNPNLSTKINYEVLCLNLGIAYRFIQD